MRLTHKIVLSAFAIVTGIWFYLSPYIVAKDMKKAAEAHDAVALSNHINFPALKESLKANFNAMLATDLMQEKEENPLKVLGAAMAAAFINPMIDALVTPESLAMMMQGEEPLVEGKKSTHVTETETIMAYEDFDRFGIAVKQKGSSSEPVTFVLHREGMTWKLASIRLPRPNRLPQ